MTFELLLVTLQVPQTFVEIEPQEVTDVLTNIFICCCEIAFRSEKGLKKFVIIGI